MGLMRVQAIAATNSSSSNYRSEAGYYVDRIIGQMWADDHTIANLSQYNHHATGSSCQPTGAASAKQNVTDWTTALSANLPGATATKQQIVVTASTNSSLVKVTVCWKSPQDTSFHSFSEVAQINQ